MWLSLKLLEAQLGSSLDKMLLISKQEALAGYDVANLGSPFTPPCSLAAPPCSLDAPSKAAMLPFLTQNGNPRS